MKKILKGMFVALIVVVGALAITGCKDKTASKKTTSNSLSSIVGSWEYKDGGYTYTFKDDKTGSYTAGETVMKFTYEDDGKKVSILYDGNTSASDYEYKIKGNKLIIKDGFGSDVEYIKK